jgi:DNA replication protein DnaC
MIEISEKELLEKWSKYISFKFKKTGMDKIPENIIDYTAALCMGKKKKGLYFYGGTGTGKTSRLEFLKDVTGTTLIPAQTLFLAYKNDSPEYAMELALITLKHRLNCYSRFAEDLIIDDLGSEPPEANVYGTKCSPIADIIEHRYIMFSRYGAKTHFSSNLNFDGIKQRYGERVYSRLNEMNYEVDLTGIDRRIKS